MEVIFNLNFQFIYHSYETKIIRNLDSIKISIPPTLSKKGDKFFSKIDLLDSSKYWVEWFKGMT